MKRVRHTLRRALLPGSLILASALAVAAGPEEGVIRLRPRAAEAETASETERIQLGEARRGFDYDAFRSRLESQWFQRKALLASGRVEDARRQLEQIHAFCQQEGVHRLEHLSSALIAEARRDLEEGSYNRALSALHYAESFDPGRPQVHMGRAAVYKAQRNFPQAARHLLSALGASLLQSVRNLSLLHQAAYVLGIALVACVLIFASLMIYRYQSPFRHEVEEVLGLDLDPRWARYLGWAALSLPLWSWLGAGWAAVFWLVITFRFMARAERVTSIVLLVACALSMPAYRIIVGLYGTTADPAVRTTLASARGEYDPDRIVKLRRLVEAHPDDPVYHFLLAGLFKNGRYFEEAFAEYKAALKLNPTLAPAHVNIGNIFYATNQYPEAIANYNRALEQDPDTFLAYFNMYLAQSEAFRFTAAEASLQSARELDSGRVAELLSGAGGWGDRPAVQDDALRLASIWDAALEGTGSVPGAAGDAQAAAAVSLRLLNPVGIVSVVGLFLCFGIALLSRGADPARRCIRCGRPFCQHCKIGREAREYCSQCVHMYVLGDGLAPGTKDRKLYEVERHKRRTRAARSGLSLIFPGAGQMLGGRTARGSLLLLFWMAGVLACFPAFLAPLLRPVGLHLRMDLLDAGDVPAAFVTRPLAVTAMLLLPLLWCMGNAWRLRRKEA